MESIFDSHRLKQLMECESRKINVLPEPKKSGKKMQLACHTSFPGRAHELFLTVQLGKSVFIF